MAFLKDRLNAFLNQPIERKRSDHRLKSVDSCVDNRAWALDEELRRQHFYNVVNRNGGGAGAAWEDEDSDDSIREEQDRESTQLNEEMKKLKDEKSFLKNVIADKENEIERLLFRIRAMAEVERSSSSESNLLKDQLSELLQQYNAKDKELNFTKDTLNQTEKMLTDLQAIIESTGDDPEKENPQLDKVMKDLQRGLQDEIDTLQAQVTMLEDKLENVSNENTLLKKDLESAQVQVEALASGDENDLNRIILALRNDINSIKASKDAENKALKDIIAQKDNELKNLKDRLNLQEREQSKSSDLDDLISDKVDDSLGQREKEIDLVRNKLQYEKQQNELLKDKIMKGVQSDESEPLNNIMEDFNYKENKINELKKENEIIKSANDKVNKELVGLKKELDEVKASQTAKIPEIIQSDKLDSQLQVENKMLKQRIKQLEDEISKLPGEVEKKAVPNVSATEDEIKKLKTENEKLSKENDVLKRKSKQADEDKYIPPNGDLEKKNQDLRSKISDLTKSLDEGELQKENDHLKIKTLENELKDLQNNLKELEKLKKELEDVKTLQTAKAAEIVQSDKLNKELQVENKMLKERIKKLEYEIPKLPEEVKRKIVPEVSATEDEIKKLKAENAKLSKENESLKSNSKQADGEKNIPPKGDLEKENQDLKSTISDLTKSLNEGQLQKENDYLKLQAIEKEKNLQDHSKELEKVKKELEDVKTLQTAKAAEIVQSDKLNDELQVENKMLKERIKKFEDEIPKLPGEVEKKILPEVSATEDEIKKLKAENAKLSKENEMLKSKSEQADEKKKIPPKGDLEKENQDLKSTISNLTKMNEGQLQKENDYLKLQAIEKEKNLQDHSKEIEKLKNELAEVKSSRTANAPEIVQSDKLNVELEVENKKLKQRIKKFEDEIPKLHGEVEKKIVPQVSATEDEIKKLKAENAKLSKENEILKSKQAGEEKNIPPNGNLEKENQDLRSKICDLTKSLNEGQLQKENDHLNIQALENELKNLQTMNSADIKKEKPAIAAPYTDKNILDENDKLRKEIKDLKEQINGLEKQLWKETTNKGQEEIITDNAILKKEVNNLKDKLKYTPSKSDLEKENQDLMNKISDLTQVLNDAKKQKLEIDEENKRVLELLKKAEDAGEISGDEILNMYKNNVDKLKKDNAKLQDRISDLEKELNNFKEANKKLQRIDAKKTLPSAPEKDDSSTPRYEQTLPGTEKKSAPATLKKGTLSDQIQPLAKGKDRVMSPNTQPSAKERQIEAPSVRQTLEKKEKPISPDPERKEIKTKDLLDQPRKKISIQGELSDQIQPRAKGTDQVVSTTTQPSAKERQIEAPSVRQTLDKKEKLISPGPERKDIKTKDLSDQPRKKIGIQGELSDQIQPRARGTDRVVSPTTQPSAKERQIEAPSVRQTLDKNEKLISPGPERKEIKTKDVSDQPRKKISIQGELSDQIQPRAKGTDRVVSSTTQPSANERQIEAPSVRQTLDKKEKRMSPGPERKEIKTKDLSDQPRKKISIQGELSDQIQPRAKGTDRVVSPTTQPSAKERQIEAPSVRQTLDKKEKLISPGPERKEIKTKDLSDQPRKKISNKEKKGKAEISSGIIKSGRISEKDKEYHEGDMDKSKDGKKGATEVYEYKGGKEMDLILPPLGKIDEETKGKEFKSSKDHITTDKKSKHAVIKQDEIKSFDSIKSKIIHERPKHTRQESKELDEIEVLAIGVGRRRSKSVDSALTKKEHTEMRIITKHFDDSHKKPKDELDLKSQYQPGKRSVGQIKKPKITGDEVKVVGDKEYDNELNTLKKMLYDAEKLIDSLKKDNSNLKSENIELKLIKAQQEDEKEKYTDVKKYVDEDTNKLNRILQKTIRYGLKSLYLEELHFVHHALNNNMAERKGRPATPGRKSVDELERLYNMQDKKIISLERRLDNYRQLSSEQDRRLMDYSQKVQRLNTTIGLLEMKSESLQYESKYMRDLINAQKEKCKKLEEMLKSILENCKCTGKWFVNQNYTNLQKK